ncbi:hypothetical protein [Cetobacterium sp.]|uniref:hypothetical protein n=3 Tax=Cetobacterium sp. TaxID=2071632 RepID=UPI003F30903F
MELIFFIFFIFFIEKNILVGAILDITNTDPSIENRITIFSGICIFIMSNLFVKYRNNLKDLYKFILYFLLIFIIYFYKESKNFYAVISLFLNNQMFIFFIFLLLFSVMFPMLLNYINEKYPLENNLKESLYSSRENKIKVLHQFLNVYNEFSITGEWGVGKSFFLKYFFKNSDKNKYEEIIIDISSYSTNDKILKKIDSEINRIFKKYHIFRFSPSIFKEISLQNSFIETFKSVIQFSMSDNLNSCIESLPVTIVLCLDNIERINDLNRITLLLSGIDEQLIHKISDRKKFKVIYLYDKKYMEKIFSKESISFNSYISKYSESEIQIYGIEDEDFKQNENYSEFINVRNIINKEIEVRSGDFEKRWDMQNEKLVDNKALKDKVLIGIDNYMKQIEEKLKNPRFIEQCFKFKKNDEQKLTIENIIKYKIILDIFQNVNLTNKSVTEIFELNLLKKIEMRGLTDFSTETIELITIQFILFNNNNESFKVFINELKESGVI